MAKKNERFVVWIGGKNRFFSTDTQTKTLAEKQAKTDKMTVSEYIRGIVAHAPAETSNLSEFIRGRISYKEYSNQSLVEMFNMFGSSSVSPAVIYVLERLDAVWYELFTIHKLHPTEDDIRAIIGMVNFISMTISPKLLNKYPHPSESFSEARQIARERGDAQQIAEIEMYGLAIARALRHAHAQWQAGMFEVRSKENKTTSEL